MARKHVQRSDEDPAMFVVTYIGRHTCTQALASSTIPPSPSLPERLGMELAKQLEIHLNMSSSWHEIRKFLAENILASYTKAISMLNLSSSVDETELIGGAIRMFESLADGLRSEDSDRELKDQKHRDMYRNR